MSSYPGVRELEAAKAAGFTHYPIVTEIFGDLFTPVGMYLRLRSLGKNSFLLESAEGGENIGRYSFLGVNPFATFTAIAGSVSIEKSGSSLNLSSDPVMELKKFFSEFRIHPHPNLPRLSGGAVGFFGYDFVRYIESVPIPHSDKPLPDVQLNFYDTIIAVDNLKRRVQLVTLMPLMGSSASLNDVLAERVNILEQLAAKLESPEPLPESDKSKVNEPSFGITRDDFKRSVKTAKDYIVDGDVFQVVLSQRADFRYDGDPFLLYRAVRAQNPSPYMFYVESEYENRRLALIGSSPEMFVRKEGNRIEMRPIAGTRPRGVTAESDEELTKELLEDEKEKAEHVMLVDLGRNDIGRVASAGSVYVDNFMHVEKFSHVMHIVSDVGGAIEKGKDAVETLAACFPAGTLSGAPKVRAMEIITELEKTPRQIYGGAVGYIDFNNNMDTCIAIRTFIVDGDRGYLQAGAGIVFDSDPDREYEETLNKMRANLEALKLVDRFR